MINNIQLLEQLLIKYRLTEPVPQEVRSYILKRKRKFFIKLCKSIGIYNIFFGSVLTVFFIVKKLGISITLIHSAVIVGLLTLLSAGSITYCGYTIIKPLISDDTHYEQPFPKTIDQKEEVIVKFTLPSLSVPSLVIRPGSLTESGTGIDLSRFKHDFITILEKFYPGGIYSHSEQIKNYVNLHASLVRNNKVFDFYIRLSDQYGICFQSLHYQASTVQGLYRQSKNIADDLVEACVP